MRGVGPVHLVRVTECPASGQWIHNLGGREEERAAVSKAGWPPGKVARHPRDPPPMQLTLGILPGFGDSAPWKEGASWLGDSRSLWHEALRRP